MCSNFVFLLVYWYLYEFRLEGLCQHCLRLGIILVLGVFFGCRCNSRKEYLDYSYWMVRLKSLIMDIAELMTKKDPVVFGYKVSAVLD